MNKKLNTMIAALALGTQAAPADGFRGYVWNIDTAEQWLQSKSSVANVDLAGGEARSDDSGSRYSSVTKRFSEKRSLASIRFKQTTAWNNWKEIDKIGSPEMEDAPVFIPVKQGEYYLLARYQPGDLGKGKSDTRPDSEKGYHAWFSADMKNWIRYGPVSGYRERWVTTAEHHDGKFYIYYDNPNDEDPHLIIDDDLKDGKMGKDYGMVFDDPSHGSDCAIIRDDADGLFHLIYENWDPIDARANAWDSPLAGHAVSPDGIRDFKWVGNPVDHRTSPTGKRGEYIHGTTRNTYSYEIHEPDQNAYGDWTAIKIGGQYYLFCDYDPAGDHIRVGRFTSGGLDEPFAFVGELGEGHPDPTIGFAEGRFYLIRQRAKTDFVSPGPWVGGVEARVGVDVDGNGKLDTWSDWQEVKERYSQKPGYVRVVETAPAQLDLDGLPSGYGFAFEYRTVDGADRNAPVVMDSVTIEFK